MNKKLRDTVLIIASIVTVICVILGVCVRSKNIFVNKDYDISFGGKAQQEIQSLDGEVKTISINLDMADVVIQKGDENTISISSAKGTKPEISYENGVLEVATKQSIKVTPFGNNAADVTITVAGDVDDVSVNVAMASVEVKDICAKNFSSNVDMGDIDIKNAKFENVSVESDLGDIVFDNVDFASGTFMGAAGDIELDLPFDMNEYSFDVAVDLGDVSIDEKETGNRYQTSDGTRTIKATLDMGDIEIK